MSNDYQKNTIATSNRQHVYRDEYKWVVSISKQMPNPEPGAASGVLLVDRIEGAKT